MAVITSAAPLVKADWVPAYVRSPPENLSHGLCDPCYAFYWGGIDDDRP